jgi:hypothetical protein
MLSNAGSLVCKLALGKSSQSPTFSLVVPTLRRADTLERTLVTLVNQPDAEIVVQNNGNDPATRALVESFDNERVRHFSTSEVVPMTENWERALANAGGEIVAFIGDDDGLLPDACDLAASVFECNELDILSWRPFLYLWPGFWDERRRNRLEAPVDLSLRIERVWSRRLLRRFYAFEAHYSALPMIYNSFVKRSLIGRVIDRHGRYFFGSTPDVTSGIVNAAFCSSFLRSSRPLSVAGLSQHSTGHKLTRAGDRSTKEQVARDFPRLADKAETPAVSNLEFLIGEEMKLIEDEVLEDGVVEFSNRGLVRAMAAAINESPSQYETSRALIDELVERFALDQKDVVVPARADRGAAIPDGVHVRGPYEVLFVINGDRIGLESIEDAVNLASQLVPEPALMVMPGPEAADVVPVLTTTPLSFARGANGANALVSGWSEPEPWGTWSVDREATIDLALGATTGRPAALELRFRTVPVPGGQPRVVECAAGGRMLHRWEFSETDHEGTRLIQLPGDVSANGHVDLTFVNINARSPKELGLSDDQRPLGIGIESLRFVVGA